MPGFSNSIDVLGQHESREAQEKLSVHSLFNFNFALVSSPSVRFASRMLDKGGKRGEGGPGRIYLIWQLCISAHMLASRLKEVVQT